MRPLIPKAQPPAVADAAVAVQGIGLFTPAGASVATAYGSARLSLKFFEELPWRDAFGVKVIGARTPIDLPKVDGVERLVAMAALAMRECATPQPGPAAPLMLCLPEPAGWFVPAGVLGALCDQTGGVFDPELSKTFTSGRASVFAALEEAAQLLTTRAANDVYIGGVDSLVDHDPFDALLRAGRVKTETTEGIVPGEAAVFLRVTRARAPDALAVIAGIARGVELRTRDAAEPNAGAALAAAGRTALGAAGLSPADVGDFFHDAAGDRFGFRESAMAMARLRPRADPPPAVWTPAGCVGEIGAAFGPFALGMAAFFLARNVIGGPALVLATSDGAARGAAVVVRPQGRGR